MRLLIQQNDRYVNEAPNTTKAMWQLINKQIGKTQVDDKKFELRVGKNLITNPSEITEILYEHFTNITTEGIKKSNIGHNNKETPNNKKMCNLRFYIPSYGRRSGKFG